MKYWIAALLLALLLTGCASTPLQPGDPAPTETDGHTAAQPSATADAETRPETTAGTLAEDAPTTEAPTALVENSAWVAYGAAEDALGIIVNEPFSRELTATLTWFDGEYERAYIIPRYVGSYVNLYPVLWDEAAAEERIGDKAVKSTYADDGCIIFSELVRPEGMVQYYLEVQAPDGTSAGLFLTYNGNTGTPPEEYLYCKLAAGESDGGALGR